MVEQLLYFSDHACRRHPNIFGEPDVSSLVSFLGAIIYPKLLFREPTVIMHPHVGDDPSKGMNSIG
jgi:hypothetical protein